MVRAGLITLLLACQSGADTAASGSPAETSLVTSVATTSSGTDTVSRAAIQLALPLSAPELFDLVIGVDHDPVEQDDGIYQLICADYLGRSFPHCYDEHKGSDYILIGGFEVMDAGSAEVVAAAAGTVVAIEDGHYDRCHGSLETGDVDCDGHEMIANSVIIEHATRHRTLYWHLMKDSVAVAEGQEVEAGEHLGWVGSSGRSSMPHLHLELQDAGGVVIDPYAGPESQGETYWCEQGDEDGLPGGC